jgi:hypothetical protein
MKKKVMPLAVSAAAAVAMSTAHAALHINEKGTGEVLIFPFYSAENGNNTLVNIVNTTDDHKAVKVRILEAQNSKEVLDFNLYLSPADHFSFAISATEDGGGQLTTGDNSCTVPAITGPVPFREFLYEGDAGDDDPDTDADESFNNTSVTRTATGYIEVIEMGQLDEDAAAAEGAINMAAAMTHDPNGVPADCEQLVSAWSITNDVAGAWLADTETNADRGVTDFESAWNGGGLYGYATLINVPQGAAAGYDAIAWDDAVVAAEGWAMHYAPGRVNPNFTDVAFNTTATVYESDGSSSDRSYASTWGGIAPLQAFNATMMATKVHNDYVTDAAIAATTDWVLTFPTKTFHVTPIPAVEPFTESWDGQDACEMSALSVVNREESNPAPPPTNSSGPDFSPSPEIDPPAPGNFDVPICYESTIVQFAEESAAGGTSAIAIGVNSYLDDADGWASISFDPADTDTVFTGADRLLVDDANSSYLVGLPVIGFALQKYVNGDAGGAGVLANYAMTVKHKTEVMASDAPVLQ